MKLTVDGKAHEVEIEAGSIVVDGHQFTVHVDGEGRRQIVRVGDCVYQVEQVESDAGSARTPSAFTVLVDGKPYHVSATALRQTARPAPPRPRAQLAGTAESGAITAQMGGRVLRIDVQVGDEVVEGDMLLLFEAMKMENEIRAPHAGRVAQIAVSAGQRVVDGDVLLVVQ